MKRRSLIALLLVFAMALVGCGNSAPKDGNDKKANGNKQGTEATKSDLKIGFVTDEGGVNDQSFNQGVKEGLDKAKGDFGVDIAYSESKDSNDYKPNFETMLDDGKDLIVGAGYKMGDTIIEEAKANPDVKFAIVDVDPTVDADGNKIEAPSNLVGIMFRAQEPSFLVGYIAGHTTKTDKVGFVGGVESNIIWGFDYGFRAGVDYAAKELGKKIDVMVQYAASFADSQKGKAIATTMFQNGADIVFHAAGGTGDGVIEAAKEMGEGKWAIGVDRDQIDAAPDNVLTSAMKNANVAVYNIVKDLAEGKEFPGGTTINLGLSDNGAVGIAPSSDKHVPAELIEKTKAIEEKIISGEITVPYNEETYKEYSAK